MAEGRIDFCRDGSHHAESNWRHGRVDGKHGKKEREREKEREKHRDRGKKKERERERSDERRKRRRRDDDDDDDDGYEERDRKRRGSHRHRHRDDSHRKKSDDGHDRVEENNFTNGEEGGMEEKRKGLAEEREKQRSCEEKRRSHRHRDENRRKKSDIGHEHDRVEENTFTHEDDGGVEEEQKGWAEEMEKRRRRVQEWQELRRKKEEEANVELPKEGKIWSLEDESDDEVGNEVGNRVDPAEEEEIDPLDAFMISVILPEVEKNVVVGVEDMEVNGTDGRSNGDVSKKDSKKALGRIMPDEDSASDYDEDLEDGGTNLEDEEDDDKFMKRVKKTKAERLTLVDHSKIEYVTFRKNFYIQVKEVGKMTPEEVAAYRKELELKVHGKDVPKPIKTWYQTGLSTKILEVIRKMNFEKPMPIQAQALPVIMSGRDCIGVAKTGSGKTLAFVLPMLRHIKDQPPLMPGDGPIALIMAPTRELVQQIYSDIKKFAKVVDLNCVAVYGGSGVAQQIGDLKRGAEIVVCTPGRMIDVLCTSSGKITNLHRVTYLVMDEADRMFDMGFEPQITRIVQNIRPDRQTVLFSATFPRQVEVLAKKALNKPVEIQVGGRSVVNKDITQMVEVRPESERFLRLLEILGEWYEKGKVLIFVRTQVKCDDLFRDLLKSGYPCLSLHGGKDQGDRESTLADFKSNVCNLLIATSVAARGLDVKELELVINYDVPDHYEDYVHRVGRTGRAGRKGHAITFISEEEDRYAPDLVKALELSQQPVPEDLKALAGVFMAKVKQGLEQAHGTGYGGSGFKFDEREDEAQKAAKKAQAKEYGFEYEKSDSEDEDEQVHKRTDVEVPNPNLGAQVISDNAADNPARAAALAVIMKNLAKNLQKADVMTEHYVAELEINDFPQNARWKVTHRETLGPISEWTGASITTRGQYFPPGKKVPGPGERKLYLKIEGRSEHSVKTAKAELKRVLEDSTMQAISLPGGAQSGRYSFN